MLDDQPNQSLGHNPEGLRCAAPAATHATLTLMMGLGAGHLFYLIIFLAIVLVIFGPGKLPEVGSGLGKAIREFRKATSEVTDSVARSVEHQPAPPAPPASVAPPAAPSAASGDAPPPGAPAEDSKPGE